MLDRRVEAWWPVGGAGRHARMQEAFGMAVPDTVEEMCRPATTAVLVYDAQVGILSHVRDRDRLVERIAAVLQAGRAADVPVLYVRHVSVPPSGGRCSR